MTRWIALIALALSACAGTAPEAPVAEEPAAPVVEAPAAPVVAPEVFSRWLDASEPGSAQQVAWGMALPADFSVEVLPRDALVTRCAETNPGVNEATILGCTSHHSHVLLVDDVSKKTQAATLLHEMGHVLSRTSKHIAAPDCYGVYVMCAAVSNQLQTPTPSDIDYVLGE